MLILSMGRAERIPMPYADFAANLLDIKDLIVENLEIFTSEVHIYFKLNVVTSFVLLVVLLQTKFTITALL